MHRTTVYLPDELRDELARASREDHRSEAELIREGVERVLRERRLEQPPEPRVPLVDTGHPGLGLALDWYFADMPAEALDWLVSDCQSVWAEQVRTGENSFTFRILFHGRSDDEVVPRVDSGPKRKTAKTWADICWSLELWLRTVMDSRKRPKGSAVIVVRHWQPDQPPAPDAPAVEIARVVVGPRVAGPAFSTT